MLGVGVGRNAGDVVLGGEGRGVTTVKGHV